MQTASLLEDIVYGEDRPAIKVMLENTATKEIRIVFRAGQEMKEHSAPFPIVVEVVDGEIDFGVNGKRIALNRGMLITLEGHVPHDLLAKKDSVVRLSLNKADTVDRVKEVGK